MSFSTSEISAPPWENRFEISCRYQHLDFGISIPEGKVSHGLSYILESHTLVPILASAILCAVDILLTGDKDFQNIPLKKPIIFTPSEYFDLIKE
jgi:hypothetical protein